MTSGDDRPTVGVDIDGCVGGFVGALRHGLWADRDVYVRHDEVVEYHQLPERAGLSMREAVERTHSNAWPDETPAFPAEIEVIDGAREALDALAERYRVSVVTARPAEFEAGTRAWLESNDLAHHELVHAERKSAEPLDCLVDDGRHHVEAFAETGRPAVLFGQPWNGPDAPAETARRVEQPTEREQWAATVGAVDDLLGHGERRPSIDATDAPGRGHRRVDRLVGDTVGSGG